MGIPRYRCEMCNKLRLCTKDDTVCQTCDYELMAADKRYFAELKKKQPKRKCRTCGKVCQPNRYFNCMACIPDPAMPMEDVLGEKAPDLNGVQTIYELMFKNRPSLSRPQFDTCDSSSEDKGRE